MKKFLSILESIDSDFDVALGIAAKAAPIIALAPAGGEINDAVAALTVVTKKLTPVAATVAGAVPKPA